MENTCIIMHHLSRKSFWEVMILWQFSLDVVIDESLGYTVWYKLLYDTFISSDSLWFWHLLCISFNNKWKVLIFIQMSRLLFMRNKSNRLWFFSDYFDINDYVYSQVLLFAYLSICIRMFKGQSHDFFSSFTFLILIITMRQWAILNGQPNVKI